MFFLFISAILMMMLCIEKCDQLKRINWCPPNNLSTPGHHVFTQIKFWCTISYLCSLFERSHNVPLDTHHSFLHLHQIYMDTDHWLGHTGYQWNQQSYSDIGHNLCLHCHSQAVRQKELRNNSTHFWQF